MSDWYYEYENEERGPVSRAELVQFIRSKALDQNSIVWTKGMPLWLPIKEVKLLKEFLPQSTLVERIKRRLNRGK